MLVRFRFTTPIVSPETLIGTERADDMSCIGKFSPFHIVTIRQQKRFHSKHPLEIVHSVRSASDDRTLDELMAFASDQFLILSIYKLKRSARPLILKAELKCDIK